MNTHLNLFVRALLAIAGFATLADAPAQTATAAPRGVVAPLPAAGGVVAPPPAGGNVVALAPAAGGDAAAAAQELVIGVGEIRMLPMPGKIKRIALGHFSFASVSTVDNSIMLIGEAPGATSMMVWSDKAVQSYRVRVIPAGAVESRQLLDQVLAENKNTLKVQDFDSRLVVSGQANKATLDQLSGLNKLIPNLVVNARPERETARSVLFRVHFVEVSKSLLESIGVQWNKDAQGPTIGAQGVAIRDGIYRRLPQATSGGSLLDPSPGFVNANGRNNGFFFGLATTIASRLKFGSSDGDTRILASPELTAVSGGKARLQVGGEVPIPLAGAFGTQTVEFKPYGIIFNIEPTIGANDTITAKVSTELSQIDPTVTVAGIPGFLTRMTSTEISVKSGEMVALSGLLNSELSNAIDKVPGLGNVPVLGRLFRSDDFRNKRTDLVVLLEPEIVTAGQGMADQLRLRGSDNAAEFERKVQEANKPAAPPPADAHPSPR